MTPRFLSCLIFSAMVGVVAAAAVVAGGWGWIAGLVSYSVVGSVVSFGTALATMPRDRRSPKSAAAGMLA